MPRYVILYHDTPTTHERPPHYDLMLEQDDVLRTWALAEPPTSERTLTAELLADHRLAYLDYEGPVSNDRGQVTRWDEGEYHRQHASAERLELALMGTRLRGAVLLVRSSSTAAEWALSFHPEER